jgi:formamidopyrimidine-DNA glycosylase
MPELPEVETVCRGLNQVTLGHKILGGEVLLDRAIASSVSLPEFLAGITDQVISQWHRRGKYLLAELRGLGHGEIKEKYHPLLPDSKSPIVCAQSPLSNWLVVHLRMTGQLLWLDREDALQKHTRVRFFFEGGKELRFVDQRTFGKIWWIPSGQDVKEFVSGLKAMGPEPFSPQFSVDYLAQQFKGRQRPIKTALLDQCAIAGLGNIYSDEALFLAGVRSTTPCSALTLDQIQRLHKAIVQVLDKAINEGGTTFSNFLNVEGTNGNYGGVAWVYRRTGEPCRVCHTPIQRIKLGSRSTHFCPQCQL